MTNLNLSRTAGAATDPTASLEPNPQPQAAWNPSAGFNDLWKAAMETRARVETDMRALEEAASNALGRRIALTMVPDLAKPYSVLRYHMVEDLEKIAVATMVPANMTLRPNEALKTAALTASDEAFDPEAFWSAMCATYGAGKGADLACGQVAEQLAHDLCLAKHPPCRRKAALVIKLKADTEPDVRGGFSLGFYTFDRMKRVLAGLATFCEWAGRNDAANRVLEYRRSTFDRALQPRQRHELGDLDVSYGRSFVELRMRADLADRFHEFISRFAGPAFAG